VSQNKTKQKSSQEPKRANKDGSSVFVLQLLPRTYIIKPFSLHIAYAEGDILLPKVYVTFVVLKNMKQRIGSGPATGVMWGEGGFIHTVACRGLAYKLVAVMTGLGVQIVLFAFIDVAYRLDKRKERTMRRSKSEQQQREQPHDKKLSDRKSDMFVSTTRKIISVVISSCFIFISNRRLTIRILTMRSLGR